MQTLAELVPFSIAALAALPCVVFFVECLLGSLVSPKPRVREDLPRPKTAVLVPAHNESSGIKPTLAGVLSQLGPEDTLLVVADNCSDDTAAIAAASGARVAERKDPERRGKGYALAFGLDQLAQDPPQVVIIVDADCLVAPGGIALLARQAHQQQRPVQADYVLDPPQRPQGLAVVSALAFLIKNRVRPRGLTVLGLPCLLTGTGMAFAWDVIRKAPPTEDNLVEDMVMGLELAKLGHPPMMCPEARVSSALPDRTQAASAQRKRWEHGHLATLRAHGPALLGQGLRRGSLDLIALALELMVPPLTLLVALLLGVLVLTGATAFLGMSRLPLLITAGSLSALVSAVLIGWFAHGRALVRARDLVAIPLYVLWKLPLYFSFFARRRQTTWERTERTIDPAPADRQQP